MRAAAAPVSSPCTPAITWSSSDSASRMEPAASRATSATAASSKAMPSCRRMCATRSRIIRVGISRKS
ncbi:MAG: hypothetical protein U0325_18335 [Polyangiales bacterium]